MKRPLSRKEKAMAQNTNSWFREKILLGMSTRDYVASIATPGNFVAAFILFFAFGVMIYRLFFGLGATTNLSDDAPWGLWIGFDILVGIALAAPGLNPRDSGSSFRDEEVSSLCAAGHSFKHARIHFCRNCTSL